MNEKEMIEEESTWAEEILSSDAQCIVNAAVKEDYGKPTPALYRRLSSAIQAAASQIDSYQDRQHLIGIAEEFSRIYRQGV